MINELDALIRAYENEVRIESQLVRDVLNSIHYAASLRRHMLAELASAIDRAAHATAGTPPQQPQMPEPHSEPPPLPQQPQAAPSAAEALANYPWQSHYQGDR